MDEELGEFTVEVKLKLHIEDVSEKTCQEFIKKLTEPGHELEVQLSDGMAYFATVQ